MRRQHDRPETHGRWLALAAAWAAALAATWALRVEAGPVALCGDVDDDGVRTAADVAAYRSFLVDPVGSALSPEGMARCQVTPATSGCDLVDVVVLRRALAQPPLAPGIAPLCAAASGAATGVAGLTAPGGRPRELLRESRGTEFILAFHPNFEEGGELEGGIQLHLTAETATEVTVQYPVRTPVFEQTVGLTPGEITIVILPGSAGRGWQPNAIGDNAVRAFAEEPFTLYMANLYPASSDAALGLPVSALNTDYIVADWRPLFGAQFTVVAAYDDTVVTITPTLDLPDHPAGVPFELTLDRGEGYYVYRAAPTVALELPGLTGTEIRATRPVSVTNGSHITRVPEPFGAADHIFEVAQPVQTWGRTIPVGYPSFSPLGFGAGAFYRVVAAEDDTEVRLDGVPIGTLDRGKFLTTVAQWGGHLFEADRPIFVLQYMPSQIAPVGGFGDPSMGNMIPAEQYLERYTFATVGGGQFAFHYLTVIAHDEEIDTILFDGARIGADSFALIPGSGLSFATFEITEGTHTTASRRGHGIYVAGLNEFDSYLYPGGARFESISAVGDSLEPLCQARLESGPPAYLSGSASDEGSGIYSVTLEPDASNLVLDVDPFVPGDALVGFQARRASTATGGRGAIRVLDGSGNACVQEVDLPFSDAPNCIADLSARSTLGAVQLTWSPAPGTQRYEVARGTSLAGPFGILGETTSDYATWLDETSAADTRHYYRVSRIAADGSAPCVSNVVAAVAPSRRVRMASVPDLSGRALADAQAELAAASLAAGAVRNVPSALAPAGAVAAQDPPRGSFVPTGSAVDLDVSSGASAVTVPDVLGASELGAKLVLEAAGLALGAVSTQVTTVVPVGTVLAQSPLAGTVVDAGTAVTLVVAAAPALVTVPNLVGLDEAGAGSALAAVGLVAGPVTAEPHPSAPAGRVIRQGPRAGSILASGDAVDLVLSTGPSSENRAPFFVDPPFLVAATRGKPLQIQLRASDPDNDALRFAVPDGYVSIEGATIDPQTGLVEWLPDASFVDLYPNLCVGVFDPSDAAAIHCVTVVVQNYRPYFTSIPPSEAIRGVELLYQPVVVDPDGDPVSFSLVGDNPAGVTVDPATGLLRWTPAQDQAGFSSIQIRASDPFGLEFVQGFGINVPNGAPSFTSTPPTTALRGQLYVYDAEAVDPDGDSVSYSLDGTPPAGMTIDRSSGRVEWTPEQYQIGLFSVTVQASDPLGLSSYQAIDVTVQNAAPVISSTPVTGATRGVPYRYTVVASDADGDPITFSVNGPAGMAIDPVSGLINWLPGPAQEGATSVTVFARDPGSAIGEQTFVVVVPEVDDPPRFVTSPPLTAVEGEPYAYWAIALDPELQPVSYSLPLAPLGMTIDPTSGIVDWTPSASQVGAQSVTVRAADPGGLAATQSFVVQVRQLAPDPNPPVVSIQAPAPDLELLLPADVIGSVQDDNLAYYRLELAPAAGGGAIVLGGGFTPVSGALLGAIDTTLLENGLYTLRLLAEDAAGNIASAEQSVLVAGEFKPGAFTVRYVDLAVALAGVPIRIERSYDSRRRTTTGDFGYGWQLGVTVGARYVNNRVPGDGWVVSASSSGLPIPCAETTETKSHVTEIRFSDTEFYRFAFTVEMFGLGSTTSDGCLGLGSFVQIGGVPGAQLDIYGTRNVLYQSGETVLNFDPFSPDFLDPYEPRAVGLTTPDGREFDLELDGAVTRIAEPNGNEIFIQPNGVVHSSGRTVYFERDDQGRLARISDTSGATIEYGYNAAGDLVTVRDPLQRQTSFVYDTGHLLRDIVDPLGNRALRNEYDAEGRLIAQSDALGGRTEIDTDLDTRTTTLVDPLGEPTTLVANARGTIDEATLPDGEIVRFTYDARGNVASETDPLGRTRTFAWSDRDRLVSETSPLGETHLYEWNDQDRPVALEDPGGRRTSFEYDDRGNLLATRDADDELVQAFTYDERGLVRGLSTLGGDRQYQYDVEGRLLQEDGPGGYQRATYRDLFGRIVEEDLRRSTLFGATIDRRFFQYDLAGQLVAETDSLGQVTRFAWDAAGRLRGRTDARGNRTSYEYDAAGHPVRVDHPDGTNERFGYDLAGQRTAATDRAGRTTFFEYDAQGRLIETLYPDGARVREQYDASGQRIRAIDALGAGTRFEYDGTRRLVRRIDPLGGTLTAEYDASDRIAALVDPLGRRTQFAHDDTLFRGGRITAETFADGTTRLLDYAANGALASRTDERGSVTTYEYDDAGRLTAVVDALGGRTSYGYDEVGNRVRETDARGQATLLEYDGERRLLRRTLPLGMAERFEYDPVGNLIAHTDFAGAVTRYRYDATNRRIEKSTPDGGLVQYQYTPTGQLAQVLDARGTTRFFYDLRDRRIEVQEPDGSVLRQSWDPAGRRTTLETPAGTTRYAWDVAGRLASVTDSDGGVTTYQYDAADNLVRVLRPNGTETRHAYDARNRPISVSHSGPGGTPLLARFDYTLDAAGLRTRVDESSGRRLDYAYDALARLIEERESVGADLFVSRFGYDPAGNRISLERDGVLEAWSYDANGRLLATADATFSWDPNGRLLSRDELGAIRRYEWDAEGRLAAFVAPDGTRTQLGYDHAGQRVSIETGGARTRLVVDRDAPGGYPQIVAELDASGSVLASQVFGHGPLRLRRGGASHWFHADALGSTRLLSDAFGSASDGYDYDAFGELVDLAGTTPNATLFRGERYEAGLGLYDLRARWLAPELGQFVSADPEAPDPFEPRSLARYPYAFSDPVNRLDPSGRFSLGEISLSLNIRNLLGLSTTARILNVGRTLDLTQMARDLEVIPRLPLNDDATAEQLGSLSYSPGSLSLTGDEGEIGLSLPVPSVEVILGGGVVEKAFGLSGDLIGNLSLGGESSGRVSSSFSAPSPFQLINDLYAMQAGWWMAELPRDELGIPGAYLACRYNDYVSYNYGLMLMKTLSAGEGLRASLGMGIVGSWLAYANLVELEGATAMHMGQPDASGFPRGGRCSLLGTGL